MSTFQTKADARKRRAFVTAHVKDVSPWVGGGVRGVGCGWVGCVGVVCEWVGCVGVVCEWGVGAVWA